MQIIHAVGHIFSKKTQYPCSFFLILLMSLNLLSGVTYADVENTCKGLGNKTGQFYCVPPLKPKAQGGWTYSLIAGQWGTVWGTASTPQGAAAFAQGTTAGPLPPSDCANCNAMGQGIAREYLGMSGSSFYSSSYPVYTTAYFEGYLAKSHGIPVRSSNNVWHPDMKIVGGRSVLGFRCPVNTTQVTSTYPAQVGYPFMCKLPPEPKRCNIQNNNNPISSTCGNPVDYVSGVNSGEKLIQMAE